MKIDYKGKQKEKEKADFNKKLKEDINIQEIMTANDIDNWVDDNVIDFDSFKKIFASFAKSMKFLLTEKENMQEQAHKKALEKTRRIDE